MDGLDGKTRTVQNGIRDDPIDSEAASEIFDSNGTEDADPGSGKIGVTGAVFLILNKMIGTGSKLPV